MIKITTTKHMLGICIHGDYEDMKILRNSIAKYTDFYCQNQVYLSEQEYKKHKITKEFFDQDCLYYTDLNECILGLCYDLRHAYQGDRNFEYVKNNADNIGRLASCIYEVDEELLEKEREKGTPGNLYFNVEILYPWAAYYLLYLNYILNEYYDKDWLKHIDFPYDEYTLKKDRAMIQLFVELLWENLKETIGQKATNELLCHYEMNEYIIFASPVYVESICSYYINTGKTKALKKSILTAFCYELMLNYDYIDEKPKSLQTALSNIQEKTQKPFVSKLEFSDKLHLFLKGKSAFYVNDKDDFTDQEFGAVNWNSLKW